MTPQILSWLASVKQRFVTSSYTLLEVGAYDVNGSPRSVFNDAASYHGIDLQPGPGVDEVGDIRQQQPDTLYDVVISCETLEHDGDPLRLVEAMRRRIKPGGLLILTVPSNGFPEHFFPRDYWRIMPNAMSDILLDGLEQLEICVVDGPTLCGVARLRPDGV